jgi:hypothetical protein
VGLNLEEYLANPFQPCIRLRVGPELTDVVEVDQAYWEMHRDAFVEECLSLDEVEGHNWRSLKKYTDGNGLMAKLLIALGDLAGVWTMHPPRTAPPGLWSRDLPRVLIGPPRRPTVPKPSQGALEPIGHCLCCERPMGPPDSLLHDLPRSESDETLCLECEAMGCDVEEPGCNVFPEKRAEAQPKLRVAETPDEAGPPPGLSEYLKQFQ